MKLNRGCGCLVLLLAAINAVLVASPIIGLISKKASLWVSLIMLGVFASNAVMCFLMGYAALRTGDEMATQTEDAATEGSDEEPATGEGEDQ